MQQEYLCLRDRAHEGNLQIRGLMYAVTFSLMGPHTPMIGQPPITRRSMTRWLNGGEMHCRREHHQPRRESGARQQDRERGCLTPASSPATQVLL